MPFWQYGAQAACFECLVEHEGRQQNNAIHALCEAAGQSEVVEGRKGSDPNGGLPSILVSQRNGPSRTASLDD